MLGASPNIFYRTSLPAGHYAFLDQPQLFLKALLMQTKPYRSVQGSGTLNYTCSPAHPSCLKAPPQRPCLLSYQDAARLLASAGKTVLWHCPVGQDWKGRPGLCLHKSAPLILQKVPMWLDWNVVGLECGWVYTFELPLFAFCL